MNQSFVEKHAPTLLVIAILLLWEVICRGFKVDPFVLPMPTAIWDSLLEFKKPIFDHALQTFWTTMVGFAVAVLVGIVLAAC